MGERELSAGSDSSQLSHGGEEAVQGEVVDDVFRNSQGEVLDKDGNPLVQVAEQKMAEIHGIHRAGEQLAEADESKLRQATSTTEVWDINEAAKERRDREQAALWRSQRYYNENPAATHQAALEEDEQRSKGEPPAELPPPSE